MKNHAEDHWRGRLPTAPKRESTVDVVINAVKDILVSKRLLPGDRLPNEMELAASLSVGRGSVREAMKILSALGIVEIVRGDGTYVAKSVRKTFFGPLFFSLIVSKADAEQLVELREMIEQGIVRIIIRNANAADLQEIEARYLEMQRMIDEGEADSDKIVQSDLDFHHALGRATRNELIEKIYHFVIEYFTPHIGRIHREGRLRLHALRLHREVIEALKGRDIARAEEAIHSYDRSWVKSL